MNRTGIVLRVFEFENGSYLKELKRSSLFDPKNNLAPGAFQVTATSDLRKALSLGQGEGGLISSVDSLNLERYLEFLNGKIVEYEYVEKDQGGKS